jgi:hypothetical protein
LGQDGTNTCDGQRKSAPGDTGAIPWMLHRLFGRGGCAFKGVVLADYKHSLHHRAIDMK